MQPLFKADFYCACANYPGNNMVIFLSARRQLLEELLKGWHLQDMGHSSGLSSAKLIRVDEAS